MTVTVTGAETEPTNAAGSAGTNVAVPRVVSPSVKRTVPAAFGATVAVSVTAVPSTAEVAEEARAVVVGRASGAGWRTATGVNVSRLGSVAERPCAADVAT